MLESDWPRRGTMQETPGGVHKCPQNKLAFSGPGWRARDDDSCIPFELVGDTERQPKGRRSEPTSETSALFREAHNDALVDRSFRKRPEFLSSCHGDKYRPRRVAAA